MDNKIKFNLSTKYIIVFGLLVIFFSSFKLILLMKGDLNYYCGSLIFYFLRIRFNSPIDSDDIFFKLVLSLSWIIIGLIAITIGVSSNKKGEVNFVAQGGHHYCLPVLCGRGL